MKLLLIALVAFVSLAVTGQDGSFYSRRLQVTHFAQKHLDSVRGKQGGIGVLVHLHYSRQEVLESVVYYSVESAEDISHLQPERGSLKETAVWVSLDRYIQKVFAVDVSPFGEGYNAERSFYLPFTMEAIQTLLEDLEKQEKEKLRHLSKQEVGYVLRINRLLMGMDSISNMQVKLRLFGYASDQIMLSEKFVVCFRLLETSEEDQDIFFLDLKLYHKDHNELNLIYEIDKRRIDGTLVQLIDYSLIPEKDGSKQPYLDMQLEFSQRLYE